jgi:hypothetical protein
MVETLVRALAAAAVCWLVVTSIKAIRRRR